MRATNPFNRLRPRGRASARPSGTTRITVAVAVAACTAALAACGGSSLHKSHGTGGNPFLAFSQCMRSHGVTNFPDPRSGGGGGIQIQLGSGVDPRSPAFQAAQAHCQKLMPGGGPSHGKPSAQDEQQMLAVSQCMRAHGVPGFPDPTTGAPPAPSGMSRYSLVIDRGGLIIALPKSIDPATPAFQAASQRCGFGPGAHPKGKVRSL